MSASMNSWDNKRGLHPEARRWFAIHTGFRKEKAVQKMMARKGIHSYLPLLQRVKRYTRKIATHQVPLIPMYLFVRINESEYKTVLQTLYVHGFVRFKQELVAIPDEEIELMQKVVGERMVLDAQIGNALPGDRVEVIAGSLTGLNGILVDRMSKKEMLVELTQLGYTLRIQIDPKYLRPLAHRA